MQLEFRELQAEDAAWAAPIMTASGRKGCEYSYTTAYMWSRFYNVKMARDGDVIYLRSNGEHPSYAIPIGIDPVEGVERLRAIVGGDLRLHGIDDTIKGCLEQRYGDAIRFEEHDGDFDYLYESETLATLPGKDFHSKRNHISAFSRKYNWQYEPITDDNTDDVLALSAQWCAEKGNCRDDGLRSERCAIRRLLEHRRTLSVVGGLIRVDGKAVAFTLGSPINDEVFDVHVEKALSEYATAYTVINREFAKTLTAYRYLNRENDMGIPGLRKAKESYRPAILLKKYTAYFVE